MGKSVLLSVILILLATAFLKGQDQRLADSLALIYKSKDIPDSSRFDLLRNLSFNEMRDPELGLKYATELIELSEKTGNNLYLYRGYLLKGNKYKIKGEFELALAAYFKAMDAAAKAGYLAGQGACYVSIADVYSSSGQHENAMRNYRLALPIMEKVKEPVAWASAISNLGDELVKYKKYDSAIVYFKQSERMFKEAAYETGIAYSLGNLGMAYAGLGRTDLAEKNLNEAINMLESLQDFPPISTYLLSISDIYWEKGDMTRAIKVAKRSLALGKTLQVKEQIRDANLKLSQLYEATGDKDLALLHFKDHVLYRDSLINLSTYQSMFDLRYNYAMAQKQVEVDLLNQQRKNQRLVFLGSVIVILMLLALAFLLYRRYRYVQETRKIIEEEKKRSDSLLLNILPEGTAQELKKEGRVLAQRFESVSVMFTDFIGFTEYATRLSPEELVQMVDQYFSKFDEIMGKFGLEKIKTVGDSYMCAGGLPRCIPDHAHRVVRAAMEIAEYVNEMRSKEGTTSLDIRIGINTGPVVAGVVGTRKFAYDIWGDTVNIASRMETTSAAGRINISQYTYELIRDEFECEYRGEIAVKNRGMMKMYFVKAAIQKELPTMQTVSKPSVPVE